MLIKCLSLYHLPSFRNLSKNKKHSNSECKSNTFNMKTPFAFYMVLLASLGQIFGNFQNFDTVSQLQKVLESEMSLQVKPTTLWIVDGRNMNKTIEESFNLQLQEFSSIPLIQGDFGKTVRKRHIHLDNYIFLIAVPTNTSEIPYICNHIESNGNPRKDRFIFVGEETSLREIFKNPIISELRDKLGVATDKKIILIDPSLYNPGTMSTISDISEKPFLSLKGYKLPGRHLKITGSRLPHWLYNVNEDNIKTREVKFDGSNYRLFVESSKKFNFTFEIHAPPGQGYGALLPNGTWIGQAADLYYRERKFDIAILLGHVLSWYHFVDFAGNLDFANLIFLTSHPQLDINFEAFFYPYSIKVWASLGGFYLAISFTMFTLQLGGRQRNNNNKNAKLDLGVWEELQTAMLVPFSVALEQTVKVPRSIRNLAALWMVAVIITGTGYRCNLASYLSFPSITPVPNTWGQLASRRDYRVILNRLGVAETAFFETNESPVIKTIKKRMSSTPDSIKCVTKALIQRKTACIGWTPLIFAFAAGELTLNTQLDPLTPSKEPALPVSMSVGFVKDSVIVDSFTPIVTGIYETGIYNIWAKDVLYVYKLRGKKKMSKRKGTLAYKKLQEYEDSVGSLGAFKPFSTKNLQFSFYILAIGIFMSIVGFSFETCTVYLQKGRLAKTRMTTEVIHTRQNGTNIFLIVTSQLGQI